MGIKHIVTPKGEVPQLKLLTNGGYLGMEACVGKIFNVLHDANANGSVRIDVKELEAAGFDNQNVITTSLYFFGWEVELLGATTLEASIRVLANDCYPSLAGIEGITLPCIVRHSATGYPMYYISNETLNKVGYDILDDGAPWVFFPGEVEVVDES